jgi:hypothetical protein
VSGASAISCRFLVESLLVSRSPRNLAVMAFLLP